MASSKGKGENATATFKIALEDAVSGPAAKSATGLEALRKKLDADVVALRSMQQALRNLKAGGVAADASVKSMNDRIAAQKARIAGTQAGLLQLADRFKSAGKASSDARARTQAVTAALSYAGGPVAKYANALKSVGSFAFSLPGILVAVAAALVAVAAAAVAGTVALARYGVQVADARRNELLRLEGLAKIRNFWSGYAATTKDAGKTAAFLQGEIDNVSASVAIGRGEVANYAEQLYRMGLRGRNLQDALQGVAITAATQGDAQAQAFASWAAGAALTGQSVRALSNDVKARLGGIAARQMLSLEVQSRKLHESFAMLFSGLKLEALANGVKMITDLFSQTTATGRALKFLIETLFQPLIDGAGAGAPIVKRFFQGIVIGALLTSLTMLKLRNVFKATFGPDVVGKIDAAMLALKAGKVIAIGFAAVMGTLAIAVGSVVGPFVFLGFVALKAFQLVGKGIAWLRAQDWGAIGKSMAAGLARGLAKGVNELFFSEVRKAALGATAIFKKVLGISSPSRVFMGFGFQTGAGAAMGLRAATPTVRFASRTIAREVEAAGEPMRTGVGAYAAAGPPQAPPQAPQPSGTRGEGGVQLHFGDIYVQGAKPGDERAAVQRFRAELERELAGVRVHLGGRTPKAA